MELSEPITDVKQATPESLTDRFRQNGIVTTGSVVSVEKTDSFGSVAAEWDRLTLSFSDDYVGLVPERIVLKVYRKDWFGGGVVEWTFYDELALETPNASVCSVYDCGINLEAKDCHFVMPDLSVTHTEPPKDEKDRPHEAVVRELLKYHIRWWNDPRLNAWPFMQKACGPLRMAQAIGDEDVRSSCAGFEKQLGSFVDKLGGDLAPEHLKTIEHVIDRYPDVFLDRVGNSTNLTTLHGDAHLWNLYYPRELTNDRIILFDWETFKRGLGAYDLAYMLVHGTSGCKELEGPLMNFYYQHLIEGGIADYTREDFEYDFRLSVISCVFCPIVWKRAFSVRSAMQAFEIVEK
jgi:thiamine kinase-like enzyme